LETKLQNIFPVFQTEVLHTWRIEDTLHFTQVLFEIPAEHVLQVGFLQVMHTRLFASCTMAFFMFSREISVYGRAIGPNIFKWDFFMRTSCISWRINFRLLNFLPVDFWNNSFTWCLTYRVSLP